eukprot:TRINITY_DN17004_c0_g1_i3.p1 TRINITY_DN17004_c0_g1~~TRINITY_DN17004_c0_g1_i3.p1  ORF type:complete len:1592 (-),score=296.62 TRINITY_DN17004_c0_g1_i3:274-4422(-)
MSPGVWAHRAPGGAANLTSGGTGPYDLEALTWEGIVLAVLREYRVCWCAQLYGGCSSGESFGTDVGLIRPTGPVRLSSVTAVTLRPLEYRVRASFGSVMSRHDRIRIVNASYIDGVCGSVGSSISTESLAEDVCAPDCKPSPHDGAPVMEMNRIAALWEPLMFNLSGTFLVCWCNDGHEGCDHDEDFVANVGEIKVLEAQRDPVWHCILGRKCTVRMLAEMGDSVQFILLNATRGCGWDSRADAAGFTRGTHAVGTSDDGVAEGVTNVTFDVGYPNFAELYRVCYCQRHRPCAADRDFFLVAGSVVVAGIDAVHHRCYLRDNCALRLHGKGLSTDDAMIMVPRHTPCDIVAANMSAASGITLLTFAELSDFTWESGTVIGSNGSSLDDATKQSFVLGTPPRATLLKICYCVRRFSRSGTCERREDFSLEAGRLSVLGSRNVLNSTCIQGDDCRIELHGPIFNESDSVLLLRSATSCNELASLPEGSVFRAKAAEEIALNYSAPGQYIARFLLPIDSRLGEYRMCYCGHVVPGVDCTDLSGLDRLGSIGPKPFSHDLGSLRLLSVIESVRPVLGDESFPDAPLPAAPHAASVQVVSRAAGKHLVCVAALDAVDEASYRPSRRDVDNCTLPGYQSSSLMPFPRCIGKGQSMFSTDIGSNIVHIPLSLSSRTRIRNTTRVHAWCYAVEGCFLDSCVVPQTAEGVEMPLTKGVQERYATWSSSVATVFDVRLQLADDFNIGRPWPRIKLLSPSIIPNKCEETRQSRDVKGITCALGAGGTGKCRPGPTEAPGNGSNSSLLWEDIEVPSVGDYDVCYCDRHYGSVCLLWLRVGMLTAKGPHNAGDYKFQANQSSSFRFELSGLGLTTADRLRVIPLGFECTEAVPGAAILSSSRNTSTQGYHPRRLANFDWRSDRPSLAGDSAEWSGTFYYTGHYSVCWCGGWNSNCSDASDFTVRLGPLQVFPSRDCELSDWAEDGECSASCDGGLLQMRRSITSPALGGGVPCPAAADLAKQVPCNTQACPFLEVREAVTSPAVVHQGVPFMVRMKGVGLNPSSDRVLLIPEEAVCGKLAAGHVVGSGCRVDVAAALRGNASSQDGTADGGTTEMVCGDGYRSIRLLYKGRYRLCICDASKVVPTAQYPSGGCVADTFFTVVPDSGEFVDVLPPPIAGASDGGMTMMIVGVGALTLLAFALLSGVPAWWLWKRRNQVNKHKVLEDEPSEESPPTTKSKVSAAVADVQDEECSNLLPGTTSQADRAAAARRAVVDKLRPPSRTPPPPPNPPVGKLQQAAAKLVPPPPPPPTGSPVGGLPKMLPPPPPSTDSKKTTSVVAPMAVGRPSEGSLIDAEPKPKDPPRAAEEPKPAEPVSIPPPPQGKHTPLCATKATARL